MKHTQVFEMEPVGYPDFNADEPRIELIGGGKKAYLWIGNGPQSNQECYAVLSEVERMRALAKAILAEIGE